MSKDTTEKDIPLKEEAKHILSVGFFRLEGQAQQDFISAYVNCKIEQIAQKDQQIEKLQAENKQLKEKIDNIFKSLDKQGILNGDLFWEYEDFKKKYKTNY